jgi:hypothetical protein
MGFFLNEGIMGQIRFLDIMGPYIFIIIIYYFCSPIKKYLINRLNYKK